MAAIKHARLEWLTVDVAVVGDVLRHFIRLAPFCFFRPWDRSA